MNLRQRCIVLKEALQLQYANQLLISFLRYGGTMVFLSLRGGQMTICLGRFLSVRGLKQLTSIFKEPLHVCERQEMDIAHGETE